MKRDLHINQLQETDYAFALNTNTEQETGEGLNLTNEPSNYLSVNFPEGYKVIGKRKYLQGNKTFYILTNPETKKSSIGYTDDTLIESFNEDEYVNCSDCEGKNKLSTPLEEITQTPTHQYIELINDVCHDVGEGLNLDINFPIKFLNIKVEKGQVNLYWNDYKNLPRWMNTTDTSYLYTEEVPCDEDIPTSCIIIDKLLQFPKYDTFKITPEKLEIGGNLKMGSYEFYGAYCDLYGNNISEYFTPTNPIQVFDENNNILSQTELDAFTNFAIKLKIEGLNIKYPYYKIVCVERTNVSGAQVGFLEGIHPTTDDTILYTSSGSMDDNYITSGNKKIKKRVELSELFEVKTKYEKAKGTAAINGQQMMWGLWKKPELNLQPVANLFGTLLKWQTGVAKEDLYKSAIATSKYKGFMRDEVQPFAFRLWFKDGGYTSNFHTIARPAFEGEKDEIDETNPIRASIENNAPKCTSTERAQKWQFLNTATQLGVCEAAEGIEFQTITETATRSCNIEGVETIPAGETSLEVNGNYRDFETYINTNIEEVTDPSSDYYIPEIAPYLLNEYPDDHCTPIFGTPKKSGTLEVGEEYIIFLVEGADDFSNVGYTTSEEIFVATNTTPNVWESETIVQKINCEAPSLVESQVSISFVENEVSEKIEKCMVEYTKTIPPSPCAPYKIDTSTGYRVRDTEFEAEFMGCSTIMQNCEEDANFTGARVFKRETLYYNEDCGYAIDVANNNSPQQAELGYFHKYYGDENLAPLLTNRDTEYINLAGGFQNKLHVGALYFKIQKKDRDKFIFEITKNSDCPQHVDDVTTGTQLRYTFYANCTTNDYLPITVVTPSDPNDGTYCDTDIIPEAGIVDVSKGVLIELDISSYPDEFYVAIDIPIVEEDVYPTVSCTDGNPWECSGVPVTKYRTAPSCGCFSVATRDVEYSYVNVSWDAIILDKEEKYEATCEFQIPIVGDCDPVPFTYGEFSYWESIENYPDNEDLYDSSKLIITEQQLLGLSEEDRARFEAFHTTESVNGIYKLKDETNFTCAPIRHHKFPDNTIAPFMTEENIASFSDSLIYPLGVSIDASAIRTMLQVAVSNGLMTQEDYDNIDSFEILKGDNSVSKTILANGLGYDMYKYQKGNNTYLYPNFPHNDLGKDKLHFTGDDRQELISHPYESEKNNRFSFISPNVFLTSPAIASEMVVTGYQLGSCSGRFANVEDHPKWTILGDKGKATADNLAKIETGIELALKIADFLTTGGVGNTWFTVGISTGTNVVGTVLSAVGAAVAIGAMAAGTVVNFGRYRYQWLQTFRDLGTVYNFAGYNVSHGHHNRFLKNDKFFNENNSVGENEYLRGLSLRKYMKSGRYSYRDKTSSNTKLFVNNWSREESVFLSTGDYPIHYNEIYRAHDNGDLSAEQGSRTIMSDNDCSIDTDYERNVGSPYITLRNYVPDQFGSVDSINWLTTNYSFKLNEDSSCKVIYGGTVYISRFTWKRKISLFTTTAMGEPDKLAFNYNQYNNIGSPRFYCNYEEDSTDDVLGLPFPYIDSNYTFDCLKNQTAFYVKPPSKLYLYYYGITDFLVESEINCNYRYGRKSLKDSFYPSIGDIVEWTQEKNLPISEPNTFFYNGVYSLPVSRTPFKTLGATYDKNRQEILSNQENAVIWSEKDNDENSPVDPWLIFRPLNWYEFPYDYGKLIELKSIEGGQVLARFEDKQLILNAVDNLADRMLPQTQSLGTGGIFSTRPEESNTSDLGYMGSQHHQTLSTPYGHITVDAKRGKIHITSGKNSEVISESVGGQPTYMKNWFREHLPFKILRQYPNVDVDNNYKGLGITMGWDARHDRVFITKKDYTVTDENIIECGGILYDGNTETYSDTISEYEGLGYTYEGIEDCSLKFVKYEQSVNDATDVYAIFDTTSMILEDGEVAATALESWFLNFQTNNPTYTGNLYIIPSLLEAWVHIPALIKTGTIVPFSNTNPSWNTVEILPPNLGTVNWETPTNLLVLAFIDEAYDQLHSQTLAEGFGGEILQPTSTFSLYYRTFLAQALPFFDSFKGVLYPIVRDVEGQGGALVLQGLASIKGRTLTAQEIADTNTNVDVDLLLTQNPYENYAIPSTSPQEYLEPLEDYNWEIVADKESPASEVFSSEQFQEELDIFMEGPTPIVVDVVNEPLEEAEINEENSKDHSWTIAFKIGEGWGSYYSFKPDYYSFHNDFFQVGYNYGDFAETLWSHTLNNTSMQVFQGIKYPWIVEVPFKNQNVNKILKTVEINLESKRYQNQWDYSEHKDIGFNKMVIYNNTNNSGNLNLVQQKSYKDTNKYPITNGDGTQDILFSAENGKHYINYFYNRVKDQDRNIPNWLWDANMINKTVNQQAVSFRGKSLLERLKGQQFIMRLIQDKESRYSITLKDVQTKEIIEP